MKYIVIAAYVVGGRFTPMTIEHRWDGQEFDERQDAISHGFKIYGSDDFNIGMVDKRGNLHSIWWMDERLEEPPVTLREIGQEIGLR